MLEEIDPERAGLPATAADELKVHRAAAHLAAGSPATALQLLQQAQAALAGAPRPPVMLVTARALAALDSAEAGAALDAVIEAASATGDLETLWQALADRARGARDGGLSDWLRAAEAIAGLRRVPLGYRLDSALLQRRMPALRAAIRVAAGPGGDAAAACRLVEAAKARGIAGVLSQSPRQGGAVTPEDAELDALSAEADRLEYAAYANGAWTPELRAASDALRRRRASTLERVRLADARARGLSEPPAFDLDATRAILSHQRHCALTLFLDQERDAVVAVLVDGDGVAVGERALDATSRTRLDR